MAHSQAQLWLDGKVLSAKRDFFQRHQNVHSKELQEKKMKRSDLGLSIQFNLIPLISLRN